MAFHLYQLNYFIFFHDSTDIDWIEFICGTHIGNYGLITQDALHIVAACMCEYKQGENCRT